MGIVIALVVIIGASGISALSGVGKGVKWLSNINIVLSIVLLSFFIIFGATWFGFSAMFIGLWDYVLALRQMRINVFKSDRVADSEAFKLAQWQGWWPVFYWAWWIAFALFVFLFLARISRGRTIREFVFGAITQVKAIFNDGRREAAGITSVTVDDLPVNAMSAE